MGLIINRLRAREEAKQEALTRQIERMSPDQIEHWLNSQPEKSELAVLDVEPPDRYASVRKERIAICAALGLEPWADLHKSIIPAIEGLKNSLAQERTKTLALCDAIIDDLRKHMESESTEAGKIPWRMAGRAGLRIRNAIATM